MVNKEKGNALLVVLSIFLILGVIGFFNSKKGFWDTVNYKAALNLPCGLTVTEPKNLDKAPVVFPVVVKGYINGCGWDKNGNLAGHIQVFDKKGVMMTDMIPMIVPADSVEQPFYFESTLKMLRVPTTDVGTILVTSNSGLLNPIQISF